MSTTLNTNRNEIHNKACVFRIILEKISFMYDGMFVLKLTVNSSNTADKSGIRLRSKNSDKFIRDFSVKTEVIGPLKKQNYYQFLDGEYSFYLPKGFCQNHIDYDVYILIETLQISNDNKTKIIGSIKLPIYPRSDIDENYNVEIGDPFYKFKGNVRILKPDNNTNDLHCGNLIYQSELSEIREIVEKETEKPLPIKIQIPKKKKDVPKKIIEVSSSPNENLINDTKPSHINGNVGRLIEFGVSPLPLDESSVLKEIIFPPRNIDIDKHSYNLLAPKYHEEISLFVHCGENIFGSKDEPTFTYVTCSIKTNISNHDNDVYDSTHITVKATSVPYWEEILNVPYKINDLEKVLSLKLIDSATEEIVIEYLLPISTLTPFLQHHLKLCKKSKRDSSSNLFVTIIRKLDHYPSTGQDQRFSALIMKPLKYLYPKKENDYFPIICFCYLSNDPVKLRKKINSIEENILTVQFPFASNFDYCDMKKHFMSSTGQISVPSSMNDNFCTFNFPFLFCQQSELDTSFSSNSFIIIDFYDILDVDNINWKYKSPTRRTVIPLDKDLYRQLTYEETEYINQYDINIHEPFEANENNKLNKSKEKVVQKLLVKLCLINQDISDSISPENYIEKELSIPLVENQPPEPVIVTKPQEIRKDKEKFLYDINPVKDSIGFDNSVIHNNLPIETEVDEIIKRFLQDDDREITKNQMENISKFKTTKNDDKLKESFKKMQLEQINLRNKITELQIDNEKLENKLHFKPKNFSYPQNKLKYLENLSQHELLDEYEQLRRKYRSQISSVSDYKIKEEKLLQSLNNHKSKNSPTDIIGQLQYQTKYLKNLEQDVIEKESIIQSLEKKLDGKYEPNEKYKNKPNKTDNKYQFDEDERNQLYNQLLNAENRIKNLQNELVEFAKKRGANRQLKKIKEKEKMYR